jgi:Protein of unknown function (DUF2946)
VTHATRSARPAHFLWVKIASWLGLLAVFSALVAPAAMLAEEVRTGKLGGLCSAQSRASNVPASGGEAALQAGAHCDWCSSVGLAPPPLLASAPLLPAPALCIDLSDFPADLAASVTGLPFSRGPPSI